MAAPRRTSPLAHPVGRLRAACRGLPAWPTAHQPNLPPAVTRRCTPESLPQGRSGVPGIELRGAGVRPAIDGMDEADAVRAEMAGIVRLAAEPFLPRGVGYALGQAAKKLGIKPRRAEAYW